MDEAKQECGDRQDRFVEKLETGPAAVVAGTVTNGPRRGWKGFLGHRQCGERLCGAGQRQSCKWYLHSPNTHHFRTHFLQSHGLFWDWDKKKALCMPFFPVPSVTGSPTPLRNRLRFLLTLFSLAVYLENSSCCPLPSLLISVPSEF